MHPRAVGWDYTTCPAVVYFIPERSVAYWLTKLTQLELTVPIQSLSRPYRGVGIPCTKFGRLRELEDCVHKALDFSLNSNKTFSPSSSLFFTLCTVSTLCSHQSLSIKHQSIKASGVHICSYVTRNFKYSHDHSRSPSESSLLLSRCEEESESQSVGRVEAPISMNTLVFQHSRVIVTLPEYYAHSLAS